jgi:hypothetical protein
MLPRTNSALHLPQHQRRQRGAWQGQGMKQGRDIEGDWQQDAETPRQRWLRRLRWLAALGILAVLGRLSGLAGNWFAMLALLVSVSLVAVMVQLWSARRGQRRWRRDSALVVPSLPNPVSRIPVEREWLWPSSLLVRVPLAVALVVALYWAIVINCLLSKKVMFFLKSALTLHLVMIT